MIFSVRGEAEFLLESVIFHFEFVDDFSFEDLSGLQVG